MKLKYTPTPKNGDSRVVRKFAFFPTIIDGRESKYKIWLEFYYEKSVFMDFFLSKGKWYVETRTQLSPLEDLLK